AAKLRIHYEPRCLIGSYGRCSWRELLEWSTRQMMVTKMYSRKLWYLALVSQWSFAIAWWWTVTGFCFALLPTYAVPAPSYLWSVEPMKYGVMAGLLFFFGALRGWFRIRAVQRIRPEQAGQIQKFWWGYVLLFPFASTLTAYNLLESALAS